MRMEFHACPEEEAFVLENEWDIAIPVNIEEMHGVMHISCFPCCEEEVRQWAARYAQDLLSPQALRALWRTLAPFARRTGYRAERHRERWGYILHNPAPAVAASPAYRLCATDEAHNRTTYDLEATAEDGRLAYGVAVDGAVVSVAVAHAPLPVPGKTLEVGVETVPAYRGQGYATFCLQSIAREIVASGAVPEYRCYADNLASLAVARKAGFSVDGRYYYYVLRKVRNAAPEGKEG